MSTSKLMERKRVDVVQESGAEGCIRVLPRT
jgi:hypothetical protein